MERLEATPAEAEARLEKLSGAWVPYQLMLES